MSYGVSGASNCSRRTTNAPLFVVRREFEWDSSFRRDERTWSRAFLLLYRTEINIYYIFHMLSQRRITFFSATLFSDVRGRRST